MPPAHKKAEVEYVYVIVLEGDRVRHITNVWTDGHAMRQLGSG